MSENERYLILSAANATSGNVVFVQDVIANTAMTQITHDMQNDHDVLYSIKSSVFFTTNENAPNEKVVAYDIATQQWRTMVAEKDNTFVATTGGGFLFLNYKKDAISQVQQFNWQGELLHISHCQASARRAVLVVRKSKKLSILGLSITLLQPLCMRLM